MEAISSSSKKGKSAKAKEQDEDDDDSSNLQIKIPKIFIFTLVLMVALLIALFAFVASCKAKGGKVHSPQSKRAGAGGVERKGSNNSLSASSDESVSTLNSASSFY